MSKARKYCSPEDKAIVLKRLLVEKALLSDLCDQYHLQPSQVYRWQKQLFENAAVAFQRTNNNQAKKAKDRRITSLEGKIAKRNETVAELLDELIQLRNQCSQD